mmetsp:Transcript_22019/g.62554  ORF Transcript_22019/g.62554 Transcript_22019/m.62554 type:complete len:537 (-) Transcript_22019:214-1824(-)
MADAAVQQYLAALAHARRERPAREYEHPIAVIGGGMLGVSMALDLQRRGRQSFVLVDRMCAWGGSTWNDVANRTTKLQTEKASYHPLYLDFEVPVDPTLKTWPSRDSIQQMIERVAKEAGLDEKARLGCDVDAIKREGNPLNGGHYVVHFSDDEGRATNLVSSAVIACMGVFYVPKDIKWPGRESFGGYISHGSYDMMDPKKLKGNMVLIVGHGGFTIENVRTCVEYEAAGVKIVCRTRHFSGPKISSWLVSSQEHPVPGHILLKSFQYMYDLVGLDVWSHPAVQTDKSRSMAFIRQSATFGVTDVYFLACAYGFAEVIEDEVERLSHHCAETRKGQRIACQVVLKCLGSECDPGFDEVMGLKEIRGYWVNGEPLCASMTMASGVQAKNFGSFSVGPFFAGAVTAVNHVVDYPEDLLSLDLPVHRPAKGRPGYYVDTAYMLACGVIISQLPGLSWQLDVVNRLKAMKTCQAHPKEAHLAECVKEWEAYIRMMKEHGQVAADAEEIPYPYTIEAIDSLIGDTNQYWSQEVARRTGGT